MKKSSAWSIRRVFFFLLGIILVFSMGFSDLAQNKHFSTTKAGLEQIYRHPDSNIGVSNSIIAQAACEDSDNDGICNDLENWFANEFMPIFIFDEDEHNILIDQPKEFFNLDAGVNFLYQVSPVNCYYLTNSNTGEHSPFYEVDPWPYGSGYTVPRRILLTVNIIYPYDYVPIDPPGFDERDTFAHHGDLETIRTCLEDEDRDGIYMEEFIHIRRHGHDAVYVDMANDFEWEYRSPLLYVSEGKHATYASIDECEDAISGGQWLAWDEDCGEGIKIYPPVDPRLNVGEFYPGKEMTLSDIGLQGHFKFTADYIGSNFIDEHIWTTNYNNKSNREMYFCGGIDVIDYTGTHNVAPGYDSDNCPGSLHDKWWSTPGGVGSCYEDNTDRYGSDYFSFLMDNPDPQICIDACVADQKCVAYTFVRPGYQDAKAVCYLKNGAPAPSPNECCVSGLRNACIVGY